MVASSAHFWRGEKGRFGGGGVIAAAQLAKSSLLVESTAESRDGTGEAQELSLSQHGVDRGGGKGNGRRSFRDCAVAIKAMLSSRFIR